MARYSCVTKLSGSNDQLNEAIRNLLERCRLTILHNSQDYWVAGEPPGEKPYTQLVTVEVLMDRARQGDSVQVTCIAKNEELPLQSVNHCQQRFHQLKAEFSQLQNQLQLASSKRDPV
ncbi:MAG: hypothetical protein NW237_11030 [Cyanobacteriota bacterium]|nr:hypothetical protein [Cyanobacteriota bacterium]